MELNDLNAIAKEIRKNVIVSLSEAGSGHIGGSLGLADVFTALYFKIMNHNPNNANDENRDRLILSIGHVAPVYYAALAEAGYFYKEELKSLRKLGSRLQGHPGKSHGLPGVETSSGSLGQGLSIAVGMALSAKFDNKNHNIYTIHGDGEIQEGSIWEAAMSAAHHNLDNIIALVDKNDCQIDGRTKDVMNLEPLKEKWESFGWNVLQCDGNNIEELINTYESAKKYRGKPSVIIAKTIMGKGVPQIEDDYRYHGKAPTKIEAKEYLEKLCPDSYRDTNEQWSSPCRG